MKEIEILRELFDHKLIKIVTIFLENGDKPLSLSEISFISKVNITTTTRMLDKLIKKEFIELISTGKSKSYKLKHNEKTSLLIKILNPHDELSKFIDFLKTISKVKRIVLEEKTKNGAKLVIVADNLEKNTVSSFVEKTKNESSFQIKYLIITESQADEMISLGIYNLKNKIIWQR